MTSNGTTKAAICYEGTDHVSVCAVERTLYTVLTIELPTQIPIVSSILFFIAIHTEVTCSAAFACTDVINNLLPPMAGMR